MHEAERLLGGVERGGFALDGFDEVGGGADAAHVLAGGGDDAAVHAVAVFLDVKLAGVDGGVVEAIDAEQALDFAPGFGALEDDGDFLTLDHFCPGDLQAEYLTSLEGDKAVRGVFHVRGAVGAVGNAPGAFELLVGDEVGEGLAKHVLRLRVAHEVHGQVHHVQQIDERAAAGEFLGGEPAAEAGDAGAANPLGLGGVDGADSALLDVGHHRLGLRPGAVVEVEEDFFAGFFRGGDDFLHLLGVEGRWFFREDVFARFQALQGERLVKFVWHDDTDGLDLRTAFEHGLDGFIGFGDAIFLCGLSGSTRGCISDGDDFCACLTEARCVILQHAAGSDNSYFDCHNDDVLGGWMSEGMK